MEVLGPSSDSESYIKGESWFPQCDSKKQSWWDMDPHFTLSRCPQWLQWFNLERIRNYLRIEPFIAFNKTIKYDFVSFSCLYLPDFSNPEKNISKTESTQSPKPKTFLHFQRHRIFGNWVSKNPMCLLFWFLLFPCKLSTLRHQGSERQKSYSCKLMLFPLFNS